MAKEEVDAITETRYRTMVAEDLWVISFIGRDRPGLIRDILQEPAGQNVNIVDMDQRVMQGIFVMSVVADFSAALVTARQLEETLQKSAPRQRRAWGRIPICS